MAGLSSLVSMPIDITFRLWRSAGTILPSGVVVGG